MTREEAIDIIKCLAWHTRPDEEDIEQAIKALEQKPTTKNDLGVDFISRQAVLDLINADWKYENLEIEINNLPSVTPQEPKCKNCKWWKDSDGEYRRGCGAESICPINTGTVYLGEGYCYLFEPQESAKNE